MMTIAEKLTKIAENDPKIYEAGKKSLYRKLARCKETGETVLIAKALGMEQPVEVSVSSKNLISYPYADTTKTVNGITFTDNGDGSVTVNGTATANTRMTLRFITRFLNPGKYVLSPNSSSSVTGCYLYWQGMIGGSAKKQKTTNKVPVIIDTTDMDYDNDNIFIFVVSGTTVNNLVFKPQLEPGTTATAYTPYVAGLSAVSVKKHGKNLVPYPYANTTKTVNGVTFTDNGDGTITVNGTATADTGFMCQNFLNVSLPKGNYTASGTPSGGGSLTYYINFAFRHNSVSAYDSDDYGNGLHVSLPDGADKVYAFIRVKSGATLNNVIFKPQLEPGDAATEYEQYKAPMTYTPDASGKVTGVTLDDSTSFFTTDTAGVLLTAEYSSDYNAGQKSAYDAFWDAYQSNGQRTNYEYAFSGAGWTLENFKPKYNIAPVYMASMFNTNKAITDLTKPINNITFDFTKIIANANFAFANSTVTKLPKVSCKQAASGGAGYIFYGAKNLETIIEFELPDTVMASKQATLSTFYNCFALKNITVTGTIANTGFDLHWSKELTIEALTSILTALSKDSGLASGKSITLPTEAQAKINADEAATAQYNAAIAAGWTIAFA